MRFALFLSFLFRAATCCCYRTADSSTLQTPERLEMHAVRAGVRLVGVKKCRAPPWPAWAAHRHAFSSRTLVPEWPFRGVRVECKLLTNCRFQVSVALMWTQVLKAEGFGSGYCVWQGCKCGASFTTVPRRGAAAACREVRPSTQ